MKMTVLYFSKTDHTKQAAQLIADGMNETDAVDARIFPIEAIDENFLKESKVVVLGSPTYMADIAAEVKMWLDKEAGKYKLAGKIGGAFATATYVHGGAEIAIQSILNHFMVFGLLVYSGGGAYGLPIIHLGPVALSDKMDETKENFHLYGRRMAQKAKEIFA